MSQEVESRVRDLILSRRNEMESLLSEMVGIRSGHCDPVGLEAMRGVVTRECQRVGATATRVSGDARPPWIWPKLTHPPEELLVLRGPHRGGVRMLFCGHLDTVFDPQGSFVEMTAGGGGGPHSATGPGVMDMKGGLVSIITILHALDAVGVHIDWTAAFVPDEETGSMMSARALRALAPSHDLGLVFEPCRDAGAIVLSRGGSAQAHIAVTGRSAHAGRDPGAGVNAVEALCHAIVAVTQQQDIARGLVVTVGPLEGGATVNVVPDRAAAWCGLRWRDPSDELLLQAMFKNLDRGSPTDLPHIQTQLLSMRAAKPLTPTVERLGMELCQLLDRENEPSGIAYSGGVSDANTLEGAGLPTLDGIGARGGNMHRTDEFILLDSWVKRAAAVGQLVARIALRREL
ncbi:MAG: M20/M25/M40 family metallo-hydrolase [Planctomycetota bacterium]|nr:M20/M25/M40 family metallo-hydrolase [Planctomycetota bacterium]